MVLRQHPVLMDMDEDEQNYPVVLAKDVRKFEMEFWDKRQTEWLDEWTQTNQLPQMVRFTLQLGNGDPQSRAQEEITRIVALPSVAVQPSWQSPGAVSGVRTPTGPTFGLQGAQWWHAKTVSNCSRGFIKIEEMKIPTEHPNAASP